MEIVLFKPRLIGFLDGGGRVQLHDAVLNQFAHVIFTRNGQPEFFAYKQKRNRGGGGCSI